MRNFADLIVAYAMTQDPDRKRDIGQNIWTWYGQERTVLVGDLCGFSRRAQGRENVLNFLAVIQRMQAAARPIVWAHQGEIVKMEADNCFAVFPEPADAAAAALELIDAAQNIQAVESVDLEMCCGMECGEILYLREHDFFGEAVNIASKLGEDLADKDEILIGPTLRARLEADGWKIAASPHATGPAGAGLLVGAPDI